jgi:hypothetical protein
MVIVAGVVLGLYLFTRKRSLSSALEAKAGELSRKTMYNGYSYLEFAEKILRQLYNLDIPFFQGLKNTSEADLGMLLNSVQPYEVKELEQVYQALKSELVSGWSQNGLTLFEDLKNVFSSSEQKKYLSHLYLIG